MTLGFADVLLPAAENISYSNYDKTVRQTIKEEGRKLIEEPSD
ncbi:hypothetical protein [Undibacterium sp. TJN19]